MKDKPPILSFEEWLITPEGKRCEKSCKDRFDKNMLWWAFHGGMESGGIQYTQCDRILKEIADNYKQRLPKWLISQIEYLIKENLNHL